MLAYVDEFGNITSTPTDLTKKEKVNAEDIEVFVPKRSNESAKETIRTGIVTFLSTTKGFGFIRDIAANQDVFVHLGSLSEPIKENNKVTFEVIKTQRGPNAVNVKVIKE